MNKEKLIAAFEKIIEQQEGNTMAENKITAERCAEAALKELGNEWVRVDVVPRHKNLLPCYMHHVNGEIREGYVFGYKEIGFKNLAGNEIPTRTVTHYLYNNLPSPPKDK